MENYVLITWASSGIWYAFAEIFAKNNNNLVLVARSAQRLQDIKKLLEDTYKIKVYILDKDLTLKDSPKEVYEFTESNNLKINYLINNAWFWDYGEFSESDPEKDAQMIQLNVLALTNLTRYYVADMKKKRLRKDIERCLNCSIRAWTIYGSILRYKSVRFKFLSSAIKWTSQYQNNYYNVVSWTNKIKFCTISKCRMSADIFLKVIRQLRCSIIRI